MGLSNTRQSWGWPARFLHWAMAVLIAGMLGFGFYLAFAFNPGDLAKLGLVQTHKSFGFLIFALACLRVIWRAINPSPELPEHMPWIERMAAKAGHVLLYLLMFAMPLSGWLAVSASPYNDVDAYPMQIKNMVFGLFEMPDPFPVGSNDLTDTFMSVHAICAWVLLVVVGGHALAALKHALINRDGVLRRMLSG